MLIVRVTLILLTTWSIVVRRSYDGRTRSRTRRRRAFSIFFLLLVVYWSVASWSLRTQHNSTHCNAASRSVMRRGLTSVVVTTWVMSTVWTRSVGHWVRSGQCVRPSFHVIRHLHLFCWGWNNPAIKLRLHIFMRTAIALQEPARLLQHLFYFIAHETTTLKKLFVGSDWHNLNTQSHMTGIQLGSNTSHSPQLSYPLYPDFSPPRRRRPVYGSRRSHRCYDNRTSGKQRYRSSKSKQV